MKIAVLYYSHKGKTAGYARDIGMYLWSKGADISLSSISDFDKKRISEFDFLILGCWTCGLFVFGQHPHKKWKEFCEEIKDEVTAGKVAFFTTYKLRTGGLFRRMSKILGIQYSSEILCLKSRTGKLSDKEKKKLDCMIR